MAQVRTYSLRCVARGSEGIIESFVWWRGGSAVAHPSAVEFSNPRRRLDWNSARCGALHVRGFHLHLALSALENPSTMVRMVWVGEALRAARVAPQAIPL